MIWIENQNRGQKIKATKQILNLSIITIDGIITHNKKMISEMSIISFMKISGILIELFKTADRNYQQSYFF